MAPEKAHALQKNAMKNREFKEKFDAQLGNFYKEQHGSIKKPWTSARVAEVIRHIHAGKEAASVGARRTSAQYYWSTKYDVTRVGTGDGLILKKKAPEHPTIQVIPIEQYFDLLFDLHKEIGHAARDKMVHNIKNKFYIPRKAVEILVSLCPTCQVKRSLPKKTIPKPASPQPGSHRDFNSQGQLDLIDLRSAPDEAFKWLLMYQDYGTKFIHLRPLQTNQPSEVALELLKIFLTFGAPVTLQSKNACKITSKVIEEVMKMWPDCKTVNGGLRHPQTTGSVACSNQDVEDMLHTWMRDNSSTNWSLGCHFVQYQKNAALHKSIQKSPYYALFGCDPSVPGSHISENILQPVNNEHLEQVSHDETELEQVHKCNSLPSKHSETTHIDQFDNNMEIDPITSNNVYIKEEADGNEEWSEQEQSECAPEPGAVKSEPETRAVKTEPEPRAVKMEPEPRAAKTDPEPRVVKTEPRAVRTDPEHQVVKIEPRAVKSEPQLWDVKMEPVSAQQPVLLEDFQLDFQGLVNERHVTINDDLLSRRKRRRRV